MDSSSLHPFSIPPSVFISPFLSSLLSDDSLPPSFVASAILSEHRFGSEPFDLDNLDRLLSKTTVFVESNNLSIEDCLRIRDSRSGNGKSIAASVLTAVDEDDHCDFDNPSFQERCIWLPTIELTGESNEPRFDLGLLLKSLIADVLDARLSLELFLDSFNSAGCSIIESNGLKFDLGDTSFGEATIPDLAAGKISDVVSQYVGNEVNTLLLSEFVCLGVDLSGNDNDCNLLNSLLADATDAAFLSLNLLLDSFNSVGFSQLNLGATESDIMDSTATESDCAEDFVSSQVNDLIHFEHTHLLLDLFSQLNLGSSDTIIDGFALESNHSTSDNLDRIDFVTAPAASGTVLANVSLNNFVQYENACFVHNNGCFDVTHCDGADGIGFELYVNPVFEHSYFGDADLQNSSELVSVDFENLKADPDKQSISDSVFSSLKIVHWMPDALPEISVNKAGHSMALELDVHRVSELANKSVLIHWDSIPRKPPDLSCLVMEGFVEIFGIALGYVEFYYSASSLVDYGVNLKPSVDEFEPAATNIGTKIQLLGLVCFVGFTTLNLKVSLKLLAVGIATWAGILEPALATPDSVPGQHDMSSTDCFCWAFGGVSFAPNLEKNPPDGDTALSFDKQTSKQTGIPPVCAARLHLCLTLDTKHQFTLFEWSIGFCGCIQTRFDLNHNEDGYTPKHSWVLNDDSFNLRLQRTANAPIPGEGFILYFHVDFHFHVDEGGVPRFIAASLVVFYSGLTAVVFLLLLPAWKRVQSLVEPIILAAADVLHAAATWVIFIARNLISMGSLLQFFVVTAAAAVFKQITPDGSAPVLAILSLVQTPIAASFEAFCSIQIAFRPNGDAAITLALYSAWLQQDLRQKDYNYVVTYASPKEEPPDFKM